MRRLRTAAVALLLLTPLLFSCVPVSTHPISDPETAKLDTGLLGIWRSADKESQAYFHVGEEGGGLVSAVMVDHKNDGGLETATYLAHSSTLDSGTYLNVIFEEEEGDRGYIFVKYRLTGRDRLSLSIIDGSVVENSISEGGLKGRIEEEKWGASIYITADSGSVADYVGKNAPALFTEWLELVRVE